MKTFSARETAWLQELDGIELAGFRRRAFAFLIDWIIIGITMSVLASFGTMALFGIASAIGHPIHVDTLNLDTGAVVLHTNNTPPPAPAASPQASHSHGHFNISDDPEVLVDPKEDKPVTRREKLLSHALHFFADVLIPGLYFSILLWRGKGQTPGKRWMKIRVVSIVHPHLTFWHSVERALGYGAAALEAGFGFFQFWIHPYRRCAQDRLAETIVVTEPSYQKMLASKDVLTN